MKRSIFIFLAALALYCTLAGGALVANESIVLAANKSIAGYYMADSCVKDGEQYNCSEDYLILYEDGTGIATFNGEQCPMTWALDGNSFLMEDEDGYCLNGIYNGGTVTGSYGGYDYVYVFTHELEEPEELPPAEDLENESVPPAEDSENENVPPAENPENESVPPAVEDLALLYCPAISCDRDGVEYPLKSEYLLLYQEGKGMVVSSGCAYFIDWTIDGSDFSFTDHMGETVDGVVEEDRITGQYRDYDYVWEVSDEYAPITFLAPEHWDADLPNVFDRADILTDEEETKLGEKAAALTEQYHCKVYIVTVDDMDSYTQAPNSSVFTDEIMTGYHTGYGEDRDAIMLMLSVAERDYDLKADGPFGNASFTNYGKNYMTKRFLDNLKHDDWYGAFSDYLRWCEKLLKASADGKPIDVDNNPTLTRNSILAAIVVSGILSLIISWLLEEGMKSVAKKSEANDYVPEGGLEVTFRDETFNRKTISRVYDPPSKSSSGGGTSVGSSGRSSVSGKF